MTLELRQDEHDLLIATISEYAKILGDVGRNGISENIRHAAVLDSAALHRLWVKLEQVKT